MTAIQAARGKMEAMLIDKGSMYGTEGWFNHSDDLRGRVTNIHAMISLGIKMGCDMTREILASGSLYIPVRPR